MLQQSLTFFVGKILSTLFFAFLNSGNFLYFPAQKNVIQRILVAMVEILEKCMTSSSDVCLGEKVGFFSF